MGQLAGRFLGHRDGLGSGLCFEAATAALTDNAGHGILLDNDYLLIDNF
jgi:hypothetical protein